MQLWQELWSDVEPDDIEKVVAQIKTEKLSVRSGAVLEEFEDAFASLCGMPYAVSFHNGTGSLIAALWALGVGPGCDVLICDYGFHAMAAAVISLGARVVPVDCLSHNLTIDPEDIRRAITPTTRAALIHCPWGVPSDLRLVREVLGSIPLVLDGSHAHGATLDGLPLAKYCDVACYSLGMGKLITGGELGCAVCNNVEHRDLMQIYSHVNRVPGDLKQYPWTGNAIGPKMRPHPVALILALGQIGRYHRKMQNLVKTCSHIEDAFRSIGLKPLEPPLGAQRVYWKIVMLADQDLLDIQEVQSELKSLGVPIEPNDYDPLLQHQPIFRWPGNETRILHRDCPVAAATPKRTITCHAPVFISDEAMDALDSALHQFKTRLPA